MAEDLRYGRLMAWFQAAHGAVIIGNSASPAPPKVITGGTAPYRMSDLAFLAWIQICDNTKDCDPKTTGLQYVFQVQVTNAGSQEAMQRAAGGTQWLDWPGKELFTDTEAGKGLLGSPNGLGIGLFLAQHKSIFQSQRMTIKSITVWNMNMMFRLVSQTA